MAFSNNTELKAAVADWLNRTDLTTPIIDFIRLVDADLARDLDLEYEIRDTLAAGTEVVTLPADFGALLSLYHDATNQRGEVELIAPERLPDKKVQFGATGVPRFVAIVDNGTKAQFAPVPDTTYSLIIRYQQKIVALTGASTNWILTSHPDVYLYGALYHSAAYLKDEEREGVWKQKYDTALQQVKDYIEERRFKGNTMVMRPSRAF